MTERALAQLKSWLKVRYLYPPWHPGSRIESVVPKTLTIRTGGSTQATPAAPPPPQLPGEAQPRQELGDLAICLHPIAGCPRRLRRRDHDQVDPRRARHSRQPKAGRAGLIGRPHRRGQLPSNSTTGPTPIPNRAVHSSPLASRLLPPAWSGRGRRGQQMSSLRSPGPSFAWGQPEPVSASQTPA